MGWVQHAVLLLLLRCMKPSQSPQRRRYACFAQAPALGNKRTGAKSSAATSLAVEQDKTLYS